MSQQNSFMKIPASIEGIEEALDTLLSIDEKARDEAKFILKRARIIRDYNTKKKQGKSKDQCVEEIAAEINETFETVHYIVRKWRYV